MNNATMQHAIAKAHKNAEQKKIHTVAKGTLSLAGEHNKRSTDRQDGNMQKAEQSMPQAAEAALVNAVQTLHDDATKEIAVNTTKVAEKPVLPSNVEEINIPRVVLRCDSRNLVYAFDVDSLNPAKKTLIMWDMTHGGNKEEVPLDFYKTLRPLTDAKQTDKTVKALTEKLGVNRLVVRARLVKGALDRDEEGKVDAKDMDAFKQQILAALDKFREQILAA